MVSMAILSLSILSPSGVLYASFHRTGPRTERARQRLAGRARCRGVGETGAVHPHAGKAAGRQVQPRRGVSTAYRDAVSLLHRGGRHGGGRTVGAARRRRQIQSAGAGTVLGGDAGAVERGVQAARGDPSRRQPERGGHRRGSVSHGPHRRLRGHAPAGMGPTAQPQAGASPPGRVRPVDDGGAEQLRPSLSPARPGNGRRAFEPGRHR